MSWCHDTLHSMSRCHDADASVTIVVYGDKGDTGERKLDTSADNFERGMEDVFFIECAPDRTITINPRVSVSSGGEIAERGHTPQAARGFAHPTNISRSNLAAALRLLSRWRLSKPSKFKTLTN
jgi:hypothetical protein